MNINYINRLKSIKIIRLSLIFLTTVLLGDSCIKHGFATVEGSVLDELTNQPITNGRIRMCRAFHGNTCEPFADVVTDENGHFKIKYYNHANSFYTLAIRPADSYSFAEVEITERKSKFTFLLAMKAFVRLTLKNNGSKAITISATTDADDHPMMSTNLNPFQTITLNELLRIKVGHLTKITLAASEYVTNKPIIINSDTSIILSKKLDTLSYFVNIN